MKKNVINDKKLKMVIEDRLNLQSVRRALEGFIPARGYSLNYLQSPEFSYVFNQWDDNKKQSFLRVFGTNIEQFSNCILKK